MQKKPKIRIAAGYGENALAFALLGVFATRIAILAFCRSILTTINFAKPFIFRAFIEFI
jgi:hypothetical protein